MGKKKNRGGGGGGGGGGGTESSGGAVANEEDETVICTDQAEVEQDECNDDGGKKEGGGGKKEGGGGKKGGGGGGVSVTAVLKVDFHCDGCTERIRRSIKGFKGVEGVKVERESSKLTVVGSMDPQKLLERIQKRTKKKLELISPKKGDNNKKKQNSNSDQPKEKEENKKEKPVLNVSTIVLKIPLHCDGCIRRIHATIFKITGVEQVTIDTKKSHVSIKGTMKTKGLAEFISLKIKKPVEVIDPKKEKEKEKENNNNNQKKNNEKKGQDAATCHCADVAASGWYVDECGYQVQIVYPPQLFSDDNPNACFIM